MDQHNVVHPYNERFGHKKEMLAQATVYVNFEGTVLTEISQKRKGKYCLIPLTWGPKSSQNHGDRRGYQGLGGRTGKLACNG